MPACPAVIGKGPGRAAQVIGFGLGLAIGFVLGALAGVGVMAVLIAASRHRNDR
jgi:hypothetical protein